MLAAAAAGIVWAGRNRNHRGAVLIRVLLVFTLLPYSLVSGKFVRYMLVVLFVLDLAAAVGVVMMLRRTAAPGAVLCSEIPAVVAEYLARQDRADITPCSVTRDGLPMDAVDTWVIVQ